MIPIIQGLVISRIHNVKNILFKFFTIFLNSSRLGGISVSRSYHSPCVNNRSFIDTCTYFLQQLPSWNVDFLRSHLVWMHLLSVAQFLGGFAVATTKKTRNGQLKSRKKKEERHCHLQAQSEWLAIVEVNVTIELRRRELGIEDLNPIPTRWGQNQSSHCISRDHFG